jgi:glycosyltransferase involved in cell wall biosynthesis
MNNIFILPCIIASDGDRDGLPNVLLESMMIGVPVITTKISAISELIEDGENGVLIPDKDAIAISEAILQLVNNIELYKKIKKIVENGHRKIKNDFNIKVSTNLILRLFHQYQLPVN